MNTAELNEAFLANRHVPGTRFTHNDYVSVHSGLHAGSSGSLVSLISLTPEPTFIIELESGQDAEVLQSEVCLAKVS